MPPSFFVLDEIARRLKDAPKSLERTIEKLEKSGHQASPTSLNPSGFKTSARIDEIIEVLKN
jgi:tRNA (guanine26-N2/guanine27-N2)-dimethyltransferase